MSTNDYTVAEKDKLTAIQAGAQVNILEGVQRNGTNLTIIDKKVNVIVPTTPSEVGAEPANINIQNHISSTSNPHAVNKTQVGLGNLDNTSDMNKPVSIAQKAALDLKQTVFTGICQEQFLTENDIVIDNTALTLTIATVKNGQTISALNPICFYTDGNGTAVKHEKSTPVVFNFTNTDGVWYFYFDSSGNPIATQTSWSDFATMASVYRFYWNSSLPVSDRRVIESVEYHKNDISWSDHVWKHSEGTKYLSGFNISHNATVSATPNANGSNAVVTLSSGSNIDDNMEYSVTHAASGSVKFTQNLGTGLLPATSGKFICISNDASLRLQKIPATDFPFLWNTTTNIPQYLTSTGVRTDVGNGYFFVYYIYALQDPRYGEAIKIKSAETDFASSTLAAAHNWEQLQSIFPTLRDGEIRLLYKLTFEYKSAYAIGTKKAALRVVDDLRKQKTTTTATAGGLLPATSVVVTPIGNIASTNVQSALQELDSEKQPVGTYSTDIHGNITALNAVSGTNTGDETLTSIKTKLGAASSVSDGYLRYQDFALLHTPTTVTASNGLSISGQNISLQNASLTQSGALTFNDYNRFDSKEPAITKNSGFNLPLGTTSGTVLEGRTFGTAANSAIGDFQPAITGLSTSYLPKWNGSMVNSLISDDGTNAYIGTTSNVLTGKFQILATDADGAMFKTTGAANNIPLFLWNAYTSGNPEFLRFYTESSVSKGSIKWNRSIDAISISSANLELDGMTKVSSTTQSTSPTTGALVVNGGVGVGGNLFGNGQANFYGGNYNSVIQGNSNDSIPWVSHTQPNWGWGIFDRSTEGNLTIAARVGSPTWNHYFSIVRSNGNIGIGYTTDQGYKLAVNGTGYFNGNVTASNFIGSGANLTGVQKPITLTTNGTSGAATFENGVMNVPNYGSNATGGSYSPSISVGSNTANPVVYSALYTKNGTVYSSVIKGYIECTGSQGNTCTFNVSTYNGSTANLSIIGVGAQGTNMIIGSGSTGSNVVVSFTNPVGSGGIGFTLIVHYTN